MLSHIFWNQSEGRLRALWRLLLYMLLVAALTQPLLFLLKVHGSPFLRAVLGNVIGAAGFVLALVICARWIDKLPLTQFGLSLTRRDWIQLAVGFVASGFLVTLIVMSLYGTGALRVVAHHSSRFTSTPFFLAIAGFCIRYLCGSVFEELFARGYLLRTVTELLRSTGLSKFAAILLAALLTALLFGAAHLFNPDATLLSFLNLTLLGLLFAVPVVITGRLAISIGLHAGWNIFQTTIFGLPNSGKPSDVSLLVFTNVSSPLWTGGGFGIEGGLAVSFSLVVVLCACGIWLVKHP